MRFSADEVDDSIDLRNDVFEPLGAKVDHLLRAQSLNVLKVIRPRSSDHVEAGFPTELHGERTDISRRAVDQNALPVLQLRLIEQGLPGGYRDNRQRCCLNVTEVGGFRAIIFADAIANSAYAPVN